MSDPLPQPLSGRPQPVFAQPVEYDENGVPYYKWPPFPDPPPGVNIIPYKDFKPKGIQMRSPLDDDDGIELDGEGIPTVALKVKHSSGDPDADGEDGLGAKKKKKKKKLKKANGEEISVRTTWYEDWEEGEDLRSNFHYDMQRPREDRFTYAAEDFKRSRAWPPVSTDVGHLYDQFRVYVGLIGSNVNPFASKYKKHDPGFDEEEESSENDIDMSNGREVPHESSQLNVEEWDNSKHRTVYEHVPQRADDESGTRKERNSLAQEMRMESFLNDPYTSVKVYLSSYARDRGFYWTEMKLRDAPHLVSFFVRFLLRNNALPECERSLRKAVKLLELAKEELPRTKVIATAIPDDLSRALTSTFGSQIPKVDWGDFNPLKRVEDSTEDATTNKKARVDEEYQTAPPEPCIWTEYNPEEDVEMTTHIEEVNHDAKVAKNEESAPQWSNDNTWYTKSIEKNDVDIGGWASHDHTNTNDGWIIPTHFLMTFLGPTTIPLTHTVGYVEESVRQIVLWTIPGTANDVTNSDPLKSFVLVEMAPYKASTLSEPERTSIRQPKLLRDPHSPMTGSDVGEGQDEVDVLSHDPIKDHITVLVLRSTAKVLMKGIGVNATWVQVAPRKTDDRSKKGGKGMGKAREEPRVCWYMEQVLQVFPSFWEELPAGSRNAMNGRTAEKVQES